MSTQVHTIATEAAARGLTLRKASPRGSDRLLLELTDGAGEVLAGQWHRDPEHSTDAAARTRARSEPGLVQILDGTGIVLQRGGADSRLPTLQQLVRQPGARLVAHRAERRGVVRNAGGDYTKVVRAGHVQELTDAVARIDPAGLSLPRIKAVDERRGTLTLSALSGRTLHQRLADHTLSDEELGRDAKNVGVGLRALHGQRVALSRAPHGAVDELHGATRWLQPAADYGLIAETRWRQQVDRAAELLGGTPAAPALVHRDLHDKQLLIDGDQPVGLLDFDLATMGEPAVDLANLLVHLQLRSQQGLCSHERATLCCGALLEGYAPDRTVLARMPGYLLSTRLRLAGVYAFRDAPEALIEILLHHFPDKELLP
jgi:tRNA A-37 threonylcarbamoyl transferase component Bud32